MWSKHLRKIHLKSRVINITRSYSAVCQSEKYRNDKTYEQYYLRFNQFRQDRSRDSISGILNSVFFTAPIDNSDSYLMNNFLEALSNIPNHCHIHVQEYLEKLSEDGAKDSLKHNILLQLLLSNNNTEHSKIYQFIVENLHHKLNIHLLEIFIFNLVQEENISAATTLLHILLDKVPDFKLSNELWSYYLSKTCELGHYLGSCLVYHEIIDNHQVRSEEFSGINFQNSHIPFLVANSFLETLGLIYLNNRDPERIKGLLNYLKRFYSYSGHADTYKSLKCSLVEAYSNDGNLGEALKHFRSLAFIFKGHKNHSKNDNISTPKMSAFNHFRWRRDNIKNNNYDAVSRIPDEIKTPLDIQEEASSKEMNMKLFRPDEERNVYTYPGHSYTPVVEGSLRICDLPYFRSLIKSNINHLMKNSGPERLDSLMDYITGCHFMLHTFINSCLCELGYINEAYLLLVKLPKTYHKVYANVLIREEDFIYLFKACTHRLKNLAIDNDYMQANEAERTYQLIHEIKLFQDNVNKKANLNIYSMKLHEVFITALLSYRGITLEKLLVYLDDLLRLSTPNNPITIFLDETEFNKLKILCSAANESKYSQLVRMRD
ncbi:unnamed protein product [Debaryomyces fabryi]|nr:unnamed protein product [Debaryomyces fabryi]